MECIGEVIAVMYIGEVTTVMLRCGAGPLGTARDQRRTLDERLS